MNDADQSRVQTLHFSGNEAGQCVLYVMSRDQRVQANHALVAAQQKARELKLPLAVIFCLHQKSGYRAKEHFEFMLEGLKCVESKLEEYSIPFILLIGDPAEKLGNIFNKFSPAAVFFDFSPLRGPRNLQKHLTLGYPNISFYVVDAHNIVPAWITSTKQEFAARTIRPKIHHHLAEFLSPSPKVAEHLYKWPSRWLRINELQAEVKHCLQKLTSNGQTISFIPGEKAANDVLDDFVANRLRGYALLRNDPNENGLSGLSPYLHYGQISSLQVVLAISDAVQSDSSLQADADALIEEIVVRKELSDNFCFYNQNYNSLKGAPAWALQTLQKHANDQREFIYSFEELEKGKTRDSAWNAAQNEMTKTGKMHGYMRMYWAKKVLEWTESPDQAHEYLLKLNDFYSIDGGDPNGHVGILWSIAGVHDRPWGERPIFGTIRYMNYAGLKRKFDIAAYEKRWAAVH